MPPLPVISVQSSNCPFQLGTGTSTQTHSSSGAVHATALTPVPWPPRRSEKATLVTSVEDLEGRVKYLESKCARLVRDADTARNALREEEARAAELGTQVRVARRSLRGPGDTSVLVAAPTPARGG